MVWEGASVEHIKENSFGTERETGAYERSEERPAWKLGIKRQSRILLISQREMGLINVCHFRPQRVNIRSEEKREKSGWGRGGDKKQGHEGWRVQLKRRHGSFIRRAWWKYQERFSFQILESSQTKLTMDIRKLPQNLLGSAFRGFLGMFFKSFGSCGNSPDASMLVREPNKYPTAKISNQTDLHTEILTTRV